MAVIYITLLRGVIPSGAELPLFRPFCVVEGPWVCLSTLNQSFPLRPSRDVIPNRAESPVRNLLFYAFTSLSTPANSRSDFP